MNDVKLHLRADRPIFPGDPAYPNHTAAELETIAKGNRLVQFAPEMRKLLYAWRKGLGSTEDLNRVTDRLLAKIEGRE